MEMSVDTFLRSHRLANMVMVGILREETKAGLYRFEGNTTDGPVVVEDAELLSPDGDLSDTGVNFRPHLPALCVAIAGPGGSVHVVGFSRAPVFEEDSDEEPTIGQVEDNGAAGDKVFSTAGGARLILKAGGALVLESGGIATLQLNPINGQMSLLSSNMAEAADGYVAARGRRDPGSTNPETITLDEYWNQVGPAYTRVRIKNGSLPDGARRELSVASVADVAGIRTASIKTRETYFDDGSWVGEGQKYQWGGDGADENGVLGQQLVSVLKDLIDIIKGLKVNTAWGPSTPPLPDTIIKLEQLSAQLSGKILSNFIFLSKDPSDPGTETD